MQTDWRDYIKLGVNHHLLYCDAVSDPVAHLATLERVLSDERLDAVDLWIPSDSRIASRAIACCTESPCDIHYNVGTRAGRPSAEPASPDPATRAYSLSFYKEELALAVAAGAVKIVTNSGPDQPDNRAGATSALVDFYCEICSLVPESTVILIEPTDRDVSKRKLIGPSSEAVEVVRRVRAEGHANMASMVDMGHLPLMHETVSQAFAATGPYCGHVHLGNCILRNPDHPLFGDKHVPWGIDDGEYGMEELVELLRCAFACGYLGAGRRGTLTFEMRPYPGTSPEASLDRFFAWFTQAWSRIGFDAGG